MSEEVEPLRRQGKCNMCGMCCRAIRLNAPCSRFTEWAEKYKKELKPYLDNPSLVSETSDESFKEWFFIYLHWQPITEKEAFKINPHLKTWSDTEGHYYTCKCFDSEHNKCTVHDNKPAVCRDYPYYGGNINKGEKFYSENCGYKIDVEE